MATLCCECTHMIPYEDKSISQLNKCDAIPKELVQDYVTGEFLEVVRFCGIVNDGNCKYFKKK